jgi:general secretion pathway protein L
MDILIVQLKKEELILASFRPKRGAVSFIAAERHQLEGAEGEVARLLKASSLTAGQHRVALALPPSLLFMRELELPITDRAKVRELLPLELKGETALDTDALAFDALPLAGGKFLAVWGRIGELSEQIELLKGVGLEPEVVTASLFQWNKLSPAEGTIAVTDGEALAAFSDGAPIYFRALRPGAGETEVARTVAALEVARDVQVGKVISYAKSSQETEALAQAAPTVAAAFQGDAHAAHDLAGAYAVAAAVADGSVVNLRRGALAYTAANELLYKKLRVTAVLAAAVVLLVLAESGVRFYLAKRDLSSLDLSIRSVYKEVFPTRKKAVDEVSELRSEIKRLEGAKMSSNALKVLKDVAEVKGDDIPAIYETEIDGPEVRLKGDARSFQAANDFRSRAVKLFDGGEVSDVRSKPDGSVTFTFSGKIKEVAR